MKTYRNLFTAIIGLLLVCVLSSAYDGHPVTEKQLPASAKSFISKNFPGQKIISVEKEFKEYEVILSNGTKIEFKTNGTWDKVKTPAGSVPQALIPAAIAKYVKANFPDCTINKISKERYGYEVELSNDLDLKFNPEGVLLQFDD